MCLNPNGIKIYDIKRNFFWQMCFSILEEKFKNLSFKNGHFTPISGHFFGTYLSIFHKTEIQTVILRCLVCKNCSWIKSYDINSNVFWQMCFSILEEKKSFKNCHFSTIVVIFLATAWIPFTKLRFRHSFWGA